MPSLPFLCLGNGSLGSSLPWQFIALFWLAVVVYYVIPALLVAFCILFPIVCWLRQPWGDESTAEATTEATPPLDDHDDPRVARVHESLRFLSLHAHTPLATERSSHSVTTGARPRAPLPGVRRGWW